MKPLHEFIAAVPLCLGLAERIWASADAAPKANEKAARAAVATLQADIRDLNVNMDWLGVSPARPR